VLATSIQEAFDQYPEPSQAEFYHHNSLQQWSITRKALDEVYFKANDKILELGCGSGRAAANIAGRLPGGRVLGVDISNGMIEYANQNLSSLYPNLMFEKRSFLNLSYEDEFDFVCSFSTLQYCTDHELLLSKVHKALCSDGRLFFTLPSLPVQEVKEVFDDLASDKKWSSYLGDPYSRIRRKYVAREYTELLKKMGFRSVNVLSVRHDYKFENKRAFMDWFSSFTHLSYTLSQEDFKQFLSELTNHYVRKNPVNIKGEITFPQNVLHVHAGKG
jgi:trans-aconitate 2-methyltransferase